VPVGATLSGAEGLIEVEPERSGGRRRGGRRAGSYGRPVRDGSRVGGIEGGRLVEVEERIGVVGRLFGWWRAGGGEWWWGGGKSDVAEDPGDGERDR
jgi:hypothetical protein